MNQGLESVSTVPRDVDPMDAAERKLLVLRDVAASVRSDRTPRQVCQAAVQALGAHPEEVPFALIYLLSEPGGSPELAAATGVSGLRPDPAGSPFISIEPPGLKSLGAPAGADPLTVEVTLGGAPPARGTALALPLLSQGQGQRLGLLLAGLPARRPLDGGHRTFLEAVAAQVAATVGQARAAQEQMADYEALLDAERTRSARERHTQTLEAVGQLAGGVAHAFNNLLTTINGFADLLMTSDELAESLRSDLGEIRVAGDRAAELTRRLLAYSRRQLLNPRPLDLNSLVKGVEAMAQRSLGQACEVILHLEPAPGLVSADADQLTQVILHLVENARDAMPAGGALTIATERLELSGELSLGSFSLEPGSYVVLSLADTGVGIAPETREHLFEPFFTTKGMALSAGLGLATVYGIVRQSGGNIDVESRPGQGTTFRIYLPVAGAHDRLRPAPTPVQPAEKAVYTILVVDDEELIRKYVAAVLEPDGYTLLEARDGEEALAMCRQHDAKIDLLVTDVVMPRMGGRRLAEKVQELVPGLPVLFMSGYAEDRVFEDRRGDAGLGFLQKPFAPDTLTERVAHLLGRAKPKEPAG